MKTQDVWTYIHAERTDMADTLASFSAEQWAHPSWCEGWSVRDTAGHILAAAEQTTLNFYKEMAAAGFRFSVFADRGAKRLGLLSPDELVRRLRARTTTTNHPPAPVIAMLGEIVVHGEDIRRPLDLQHQCPEAALVAVADNYKKTNILIGSKRRITGLRLRATDCDWVYGDGPELSGPLISLILAMAGRTDALSDLAGEGVSVFATRA
ncbi:MAG: maleylpyruvate isomerase family mycothiol-dependent enzyme [Acidimicrobiales bacterium]